MGWIKKWKERRAQKQQLRSLSQFASAFGSLDKLEASGMMVWDMKSRRLFIEQPLALVMLRTAESWQNFIQNCYLWLYYREVQTAWESFMLDEELKAVRKAKEKSKRQLKRSDVERIRRARRDEILQSDMEPPKIEPFEFFIVRPAAEVPDNQDANDPIGHLVAVGHYDPATEQMEMALWSDVAPLLR